MTPSFLQPDFVIDTKACIEKMASQRHEGLEVDQDVLP